MMSNLMSIKVQMVGFMDKTNYRERIKVNHDGSDMALFTESHIIVSDGYKRIVFGDRGPYVEITPDQIIMDKLYIPHDKEWKLNEKYEDKVFYIELRTHSNNAKVYFQKKEVDYADYKIYHFYISPFDLYDKDKNPLIEPLNKKKVDIFW